MSYFQQVRCCRLLLVGGTTLGSQNLGQGIEKSLVFSNWSSFQVNCPFSGSGRNLVRVTWPLESTPAFFTASPGCWGKPVSSVRSHLPAWEQLCWPWFHLGLAWWAPSAVTPVALQGTGISMQHHGPADPDLLCIRSLWSLVPTTCLRCLEALDLINFFQTLQPPRNLPATVLSSFLVHLSSLSLQASEILSSLRLCCSGRLGRDAYLPPLFQIFCVPWLAYSFLWGTTFLAQVSQKTFTDSFLLPLWNSPPEAINTKQHRCLHR